jgi:hypothetical protein
MFERIEAMATVCPPPKIKIWQKKDIFGIRKRYKD